MFTDSIAARIAITQNKLLCTITLHLMVWLYRSDMKSHQMMLYIYFIYKWMTADGKV